jgi:hypothetical protein
MGLLLGIAGLAVANPNHVEEKPWAYPEGFYNDRTEYPEDPNNDYCPGPQEITCGDLINPAELNPSGDWDWYVIQVPADGMVSIGTDDSNPGDDTDTYLELYADDCVTLLATDDDGGPGYYSLISINLTAGTYNVKCRGYADVATGPYRLFVDCIEPLENDTCEGAEMYGYFLECCTVGTIHANTAGASPDYSPTNYCTGYSQAAGNDLVWYVDLAAGDHVVLDMVAAGWDAALYILTDCDDMDSCIIGADDPEHIDWIVPADGRYYVVCDAYSSGMGDFSLNYNLECGSTATEQGTWGNIKAIYR